MLRPARFRLTAGDEKSGQRGGEQHRHRPAGQGRIEPRDERERFEPSVELEPFDRQDRGKKRRRPPRRAGRRSGCLHAAAGRTPGRAGRREVRGRRTSAHESAAAARVPRPARVGSNADDRDQDQRPDRQAAGSPPIRGGGSSKCRSGRREPSARSRRQTAGRPLRGRARRTDRGASAVPLPGQPLRERADRRRAPRAVRRHGSPTASVRGGCVRA